jgi:hypothetical protein
MRSKPNSKPLPVILAGGLIVREYEEENPCAAISLLEGQIDPLCNRRTDSEQFMYDLIQGYSGGISDKSINNVLCFGEWDRSFFSDENGED